MQDLLKLLVSSTLLIMPMRAQAADNCRLVKAGELPVRFEHDRPMVRVAINNQPVWMLIDTGAASSLLFGGAARILDLRKRSTAGGMRFYGVGGGQDAYTAVVNQLSFAGVTARDVRFFVIGSEGDTEDAGVIGRDLLGNWNLEFDLAENVVRLWTSQSCGDRVLAYWTRDPDVADLHQAGRDGEYMVAITLNGHRGAAVFDSGAQATTLTPAAAQAAHVAANDLEESQEQVHGVGETHVSTRLAHLASLQLGAETVKNVRIIVADMFSADTESATGSILEHPVGGMRQPDMLLGADFLRAHRVLLAPDQHRFYFTYLGGSIFRTPQVNVPITPSH